MNKPSPPYIGPVHTIDGVVTLRPVEYKRLLLEWWNKGADAMLAQPQEKQPKPAVFAPKTYLHCFPVSGNFYDAVRAVGNLGWSDFIVQIDYGNTFNSLVLLRFPLDWPKDARGPLSARQASEA